VSEANEQTFIAERWNWASLVWHHCPRLCSRSWFCPSVSSVFISGKTLLPPGFFHRSLETNGLQESTLASPLRDAWVALAWPKRDPWVTQSQSQFGRGSQLPPAALSKIHSRANLALWPGQ